MEFDFVQIMGSVGVPTALCFYVLHCVNKELRELNNNIIELNCILRNSVIKVT